MSRAFRLGWILVLAAPGWVACGGSAPKGATPSGEPANASERAPETIASAAPQSTTSSPPRVEPQHAAGNSEPAPAGQAAPARSLGERMFAPALSHVINDSSSALKEAAQRECEKKFSEDLAAQASCREKERGKFTADALVLEKKSDGALFTMYKRSGSSLVEVANAKVKVTEDTPERLRLSVLSENGTRPLFAKKKEIVILSASESSIEIDDPVYGKLVYEARIGLINPSR